jgi:hypothetical protein
LEIGVAFAEENPATGKTIIINSTFTITHAFRRGLAIGCTDGGLIRTLPAYVARASSPCRYAVIFAPDFASEINHFRRGYEQPMAERLKIAALSAGPALAGFRPISRNLLIEPLINGFHPLDYFLIRCHYNNLSALLLDFLF